MIRPDSLSRLTADAAERRADSAAIHLADHTISWAEVELAVGRLAAALVALGVGRGDRVGVLHRKSADGFVAAHAVVRVGAVAVPLDPTASADYLRSVTELAGCRAIISHDPCRAAATELAGLPTIGAVIGLSPRPAGAGAGEIDGPRTTWWRSGRRPDRPAPASTTASTC